MPDTAIARLHRNTSITCHQETIRQFSAGSVGVMRMRRTRSGYWPGCVLDQQQVSERNARMMRWRRPLRYYVALCSRLVDVTRNGSLRYGSRQLQVLAALWRWIDFALPSTISRSHSLS